MDRAQAMTVGLIIPAYNAAETLPRLLDAVEPFLEKRHILVVDDGSTDATSGVSRAQGVTVISHPENLGKGAALRTGFRWAIDQRYDAVLTLDADGQHDPREIPRFFDGGLHAADILIGSRMAQPDGMPPHRRLSNRLTSAIISLRIGQRVEDSQSGYRLIRTSVLKQVQLVTTRFETESELLIKAGLLGYRIHTMPIRSLYTASTSAIRPCGDTWRFLVLVVKSVWW